MKAQTPPPFLRSPATYVVAEAEINHNGDPDIALRMVDAARAAGADAVKFQYVVAAEIATPDSPFYALFKGVELDQSAFRRIMDHATAAGLDCFLTVPSLGTLAPVLALQPPMLKIGSTNLTNLPLLAEIGRTGLPVLLSTGLGTLGEVEAALEALQATPELVGLFHCAVKYPAPAAILNLRAISTMQAAFPGYAIGFSDHSVGEVAAVAAVALGARMVEKHFTLDRAMQGPDHSFSTDPEGFRRLVVAIRDTEAALGDGTKRPSAEELPMVKGARRYVVAAKPLQRGRPIPADALTARRIPADREGMEPALAARIAGWPAPRDYAVGEPLCWSDFASGGQAE